MRRSGLYSIIALLLLPATLRADTLPPQSSGELRLFAATSLAPLATETANRMRKTGTRIQLRIGGSESALQAVADGSADAALVARELDAAERTHFSSRVIGHDSLLLVVHERNPMEEISTDQVRSIFSRQVSEWHQIGASNGGAIVPVTRKRDSGARTVIDRAFDIGEVIPAGIVEIGSNLAAVLYIAADPQAIGYVSAGTVDHARQRGLRVKALHLDGLAPNADSCTKGRYLLCRPLLLVVRRNKAASPALHTLEHLLGGTDSDLLLAHYGFASPAGRQ